MAGEKSPDSIESTVLSRIQRWGRGCVVLPANFLDLGIVLGRPSCTGQSDGERLQEVSARRFGRQPDYRERKRGSRLRFDLSYYDGLDRFSQRWPASLWRWAF